MLIKVILDYSLSEVCVDCNLIESCRFKKCHLLLVSSPVHNSVSGDTPDYLCSGRVSLDPLSVYLKDSALLTGLFKCPDTLGQNLGPARAGSYPRGPVFVWLCTAKVIWGETFRLSRVKMDRNQWKELGFSTTVQVCSLCFMLQQYLALCQLKAFCSRSTRIYSCTVLPSWERDLSGGLDGEQLICTWNDSRSGGRMLPESLAIINVFTFNFLCSLFIPEILSLNGAVFDE